MRLHGYGDYGSGRDEKCGDESRYCLKKVDVLAGIERTKDGRGNPTSYERRQDDCGDSSGEATPPARATGCSVQKKEAEGCDG